jgi:hypothetical protein
LDGNLDVPFFGIRLKDNRHSVSSLYARMEAGVRIDDDILNAAPVCDTTLEASAAASPELAGFDDASVTLATV